MKGDMIIQEAISKYLDAIRQDYRRWTYPKTNGKPTEHYNCLLYTSDAADE